MLRVYNDHNDCHIRLPDMNNLDEVRKWAECAAKVGHDALYRVFKPLSDTEPTHARFLTAFSVLGGKVTEHRDVTIPGAHWGPK
jgi:hypothetical protein